MLKKILNKKSRKRMIKKMGRNILRSPFVIAVISSLVVAYMRFVNKTSPAKLLSDDFYDGILGDNSTVFALWHGQHFMSNFALRKGDKIAVLISKSSDGELNASIAEKFGVKTIRGSGGRRREVYSEKGGARAIFQMIEALKNGYSVTMTADIPKGKSRECGLGIITLAKLSGFPIVPVAYASSRRKIFHNSWDKSTMNLPFGRSCFCRGEAIFVGKDADPKEMEEARLAVEHSLNEATRKAYEYVDSI